MVKQLNTQAVQLIRAQFPILAQSVQGEPLIYLDNAATTQKPRAVVEAMMRYYEQDNANIHRGVHTLAERATSRYEQARQQVARFMDAPVESVIFTSGTTTGLNFIAERLVLPQLEAGDQIWLTPLEHHANLVPWQVVAERTGAQLVYMPVDATGAVDMVALEKLDTDCVRVIAVQHVSNVLGVAQPIQVLSQWAKAHQCLIVVDGAQAVPHLNVSVEALGVDAYCWSGHKVYGPTGIGVCYLAPQHHENCAPFFYGGEMIHQVGDYHATYAAAPHKFEGGTPPIAQAIGLAEAIQFVSSIGLSELADYEDALVAQLVQGLQAIPGVTIYGAGHGIVSFNIEGVHPHDAATGYDVEGIAVRAGHHCAQPLMRHLGVSATLRASVAVYNTTDEIARFITTTQRIKEFFLDGIS